MHEHAARVVLLVRAIEEADREGRVLPLRTRAAASARALPDRGQNGPLVPDEVAVSTRARILFEDLAGRHPALRRTLGAARLDPALTILACLAGLALGLSTNLLGPERQINLLAFPVLALLAWNLAVYLVALASLPLRLRPGPRKRPVGPAERLVAGLQRKWLSVAAGARRGEPGTAEILGAAMTGFAGMWRRAAAGLLRARLRRALHLGAGLTLTGALGGMYLRGIAFEYRATWESTLLDAPEVQRILGAVLGAAASMLDTPVPDVAPLRAPGSGEAAVWIHLYALTALLVVLAPRLCLALAAGWRVANLRSRVDPGLDEAWARKLLAPARGESFRIGVTPYSYRPSDSAIRGLKTLLRDQFGALARIDVAGALDYGAAADDALGDAPPVENGNCSVVVFSLAQTPEVDVHGAFLAELASRLGGRGERLLVLADSSRFRKRVDDADRVLQRTAAWRRIAREAGLPIVEIDLESVADEGDEDALAALGAALRQEEASP